MTIGDFEKTSWGWQLSQLQQQVGEWLELQTSRFERSLPLSKWSLPRWSEDLIKAIAWLLVPLSLVWLCWQLWRLLQPYLYFFVSQTRNSTDKITTQASELSVAAWLKRSQTSSAKVTIVRLAAACIWQRCNACTKVRSLPISLVAPTGNICN